MALYLLINSWLAVTPSDLSFDKSLNFEESPIRRAAALFHYRAAAVLTVVSAMASILVTTVVIARHVDRSHLRHHFSLLALLAGLAMVLNALAESGLSAQLRNIACAGSGLTIGEAIQFCHSPDVIGPWIRGSALNLRQIINLPLSAAAAGIGYASFALAIGASRDGDVRERMIAFVVASGGVMLACVTLLDREYARWAFAGASAGKLDGHGSGSSTIDGVEAFVDGITFYSGAASSALLAMIWLFSAVILIWKREAVAGGVERLLSRGSSFYAVLAVVAPIILTIFQKLFHA